MEVIMDTPIYTDDIGLTDAIAESLCELLTGMSILEVAKEIRNVEDGKKEIS